MGTKFPAKCPTSEKPVKCGDGQCHSDYLSCLRSLSSMEREKDLRKIVDGAFEQKRSSLRKTEWPSKSEGVPLSDSTASISNHPSTSSANTNMLPTTKAIQSILAALFRSDPREVMEASSSYRDGSEDELKDDTTQPPSDVSDLNSLLDKLDRL